MSSEASIHDLIAQGDTIGVRDLLRKDPALAMCRDEYGDTPLHTACWEKQIGIIGMLMAHNVDLNAVGDQGRTPLHYAVHEGGAISAPIVVGLLARGADPDIKDSNGFTPADWAKVQLHDGLKEVLAAINDYKARKKQGGGMG